VTPAITPDAQVVLDSGLRRNDEHTKFRSRDVPDLKKTTDYYSPPFLLLNRLKRA